MYGAKDILEVGQLKLVLKPPFVTGEVVSLDSQTNLVAANVNDGDHNIITDHDAFVSVSGKDEHGSLGINCGGLR